MSKEAMKLALEALEYWDVHGKLHQPTEEAITALREALAEQPAQQEPVAIALNTGTKQGVKWLKNVEHGQSLYTSPPAQRKPLTDGQAEAAFKAWHYKHGNNTQGIKWVDDLLRSCWKAAIEAAHGIKENT